MEEKQIVNSHEPMSLMEKQKLFNADGLTENQPIIGGNSTGLLAVNLGKYSGKKWWKDLYRKMGADFWLPERVSMTNDKIDINMLTPEDREAYEAILSFLTFLDSIQTINPSNFINYISAPDIKLLITFQAFQEAIHSQSYSYIIESIFQGTKKNEIYDLWRSNSILKERNQYIAKIYQDFIDNPTNKNFIRAIIANYILEGIYFYNGFKFFYNLEERSMMMGSSAIIRLINRDEISHLILYENLLIELKNQFPELFNREEIFELFKQAVNFEETFSKSILSKCLGFSSESIEQYTRFLANKRLKMIGYIENPYSEYTENPHRQWDEQLEGTSSDYATEDNNFTGTPTSYVKADNYDWDNLD